jgi:hypothetical protein
MTQTDHIGDANKMVLSPIEKAAEAYGIAIHDLDHNKALERAITAYLEACAEDAVMKEALLEAFFNDRKNRTGAAEAAILALVPGRVE